MNKDPEELRDKAGQTSVGGTLGSRNSRCKGPEAGLCLLGASGMAEAPDWSGAGGRAMEEGGEKCGRALQIDGHRLEQRKQEARRPEAGTCPVQWRKGKEAHMPCSAASAKAVR